MSIYTEQVKKDKQRLVESLLNIPAVFCSEVFQEDFTTRGPEQITWNEAMIRDDGLPYDKLRTIHTLASNKQSLHKQGITP